MQSYAPPYFTDSDRIAKIRAILPDIDSVYKEYAEKNHFPGYAYGIIVDGELFHSGAGGFIDIKRKIPSTAKSMYRVASMTKSFTAMAILKLRDENQLTLDDPVHLYIPEISKLQFVKDAPVITIRDLLIHSAGFPSDDPWADRRLGDTEEEFLALLKQGLSFSNVTGITYEYSNLAYAMLGYIIKKITGIPYQQFIDTLIGLNDIAWDFKKVTASQLVQGYKWIDNQWNEEDPRPDGVFGAMGGIIASVESFGRYAALHQHAWPPRDDNELGPIKRSSIREMHQPWKFRDLVVDKYPDGRECIVTSASGYGLYWLRDSLGRVIVGHSGGLPGFGSNWCIMPEYGIGVVVFANVTYAPASKINHDVLDKIVVAAQLKPRQLPSSNILKQRKEELVKLLPDWNNAEKSEIFASNFFLDHSQQTRRQESIQLFAKAGKIISVGEVFPENQLRGHFIIKGEKANLHISFALTPENPPLIQQYQIKEVLMD